jgi:hypothetical protein|nr:MAG TPA: hypothetical protein [Crassvirales sp.]
MIQFNELRINPQGTQLIIDVSVIDSIYYQNVYLDTISIDTQDTFTESGPSTSTVYKTTISGNSKSTRLELGISEILPSLLDNMFFVWVKTKGTPSSSTPCGEDNTLTLGVVIALYPLYQQSLNYIKEVENECIIPKKFINFILQLKAFQLSVRTGHYPQAIKYWERFFKDIRKDAVVNKCGCYGGLS